jgi:UDP-2,3-diacylglucosamine pyrophosphatase LpxH
LTSARGYMRRIAQGLGDVMERARSGDPEVGRTTFDLGADRMILLSDVHRGARNAADEFLAAEGAYRAALAYYLRLGHTLVLLGDAEELWEERPAVVLEAYRETFDLEAAFHRRGRYRRIWGNHDDEWRYPDRVEELLQPVYGGEALRVCEGVLVSVTEGNEPLGELFLVHGHQGDWKSDRWSSISRLVIRFLWRPYQRLTHAKVNTPATSWDLRYRLNRAMYAWAERQAKLVLIAGHTHNPVFRPRVRTEELERELSALEAAAGATPNAAQLAEQAELVARLEWERTAEQEAHRLSDGVTFSVPCYFNTGCCCYDDGHITGIELIDGEIRLVRWPDAADAPHPVVLERASLREVFAAL